MNFFRQLFCFHRTVRVIRYHKKAVPAAWVGKELYVDDLDVVNFVQCVHCDKIFSTNQKEKLRAAKVTE